MKKLIITTISFTIGTTLLQAQGLVSFTASAEIETNTSSYYAQDIGSYVSGRTGAFMPDAYNYIVLEATSTNAADEGNPFGPDWSPITYAGGGIAMGTNSATPGSITGFNDGAGFASDLNPDSLYYVMVVGWSSNLGSWTQIQGDIIDGFEGNPAGYFGISDIGTITPTLTPSPGAVVFGGTGVPVGSLVLYAVPEPTGLALAGLGGLLVLSLRREKVINKVS